MRRRHGRFAAVIVAALASAGVAVSGAAQAATAQPVQWCGPGSVPTDAPDAVAGAQIHVVYAVASDAPDRFALLSSGISTDLAAGAAWWQTRDSSRVPRFDLAAFPCLPSLGALDISDVRLPHDSSFYAGSSSLFNSLADDLVALGFSNAHKKYLVYYDSPTAIPGEVCGQGHEDPTGGGAAGYAEVYLAPNLTSGPTENGCGDIGTPDDRGGYSAIVAVHELLHTLGAVDTTTSPGPPNACPGSPAHVCDNALDIMEPQGTTYWLDDTYLDYGNDDYYGMPASDRWWDIQDSVWLRHLNAPTYTLEVKAGVGVASTVSDLPGVACTGSAPCVSTWDANTSVTLTAAPAAGYVRVRWGGACASARATDDCTVALTANQAVTVSYLKELAVAAFTAPRQIGARLQVTLRLSRAPLLGEASAACRATAGLKLVSHAITGTLATCAWSVPARLRGRRVTGRITVERNDGTSVGRAWSLRLRR